MNVLGVLAEEKRWILFVWSLLVAVAWFAWFTFLDVDVLNLRVFPKKRHFEALIKFTSFLQSFCYVKANIFGIPY
jgi:hypothetical protein